MFLFKKKKEIPLESKKLLDFYNDNKDLFVDFSNMEERREIVKKIYDVLKYTGLPERVSKIDKELGIPIYRGVSASDVESLKIFGMQFTDGDVFYGGRASICGTGIYTFVDDKDSAYKYATDGYTNDIGIVIEGMLDKNTRIIKLEELSEKKEKALERLSTYPALENFLKVLEDDGAFAAILGYQAIYAEDKKYMVVLDRTQLSVNTSNMIRQLADLAVSKSR